VSDEVIYILPPDELIPNFMMREDQLAERRDWGHTPLQIEEVHAQFNQGEGMKCAVLDTGCDLEHPDLRENVASSRDFTNSPTGPRDVQGHGTHCCGVIAASNNGSGIVGVAPKAKLVIAKVLGDRGSGSNRGIAEGIRWALTQGVNVISMSLGSPQPDTLTRQAIQEAARMGVFVVCAAGNEGPNEGTVGFPGGYDESLCVGAVDRNLSAARFSSRGAALDVAAPGVEINSCYPGGRYSNMSGTSMATPYVAGCLLLYLAELKKRGREQPSFASLLTLLSQTCKELGTPGHDHTFGFGVVQPLAMLKLLGGVITPPPKKPKLRYSFEVNQETGETSPVSVIEVKEAA
jgi:subtilisin